MIITTGFLRIRHIRFIRWRYGILFNSDAISSFNVIQKYNARCELLLVKACIRNCVKMNFLLKFIRCLCVCLIKERGSWSPETNEKTHLNDKKQKTKISTIPSIVKTEIKKPEWLKQWTISKGWMHNRSHMLNLSTENEDKTPSSSISTADIDDLVSIDNFSERVDYAKTKTATVDNIQDFTLIFSQISENYRKNFPEVSTNSNDLSLPEVYKEKLLQTEKSFLEGIWSSLKPKKKMNVLNCKYTVNNIYNSTSSQVEDTYKSFDDIKFKLEEPNLTKLQLWDSKCIKDQAKLNRSTLGKNLALHNTLNSKTNLHEDTIYECSEDNFSLYNNPIYVSTENDAKYYSFHNNKYIRTPFISGKRPYDSIKRKLRTEKYIIRHIKVRIMLTLRLSKFKLYKKERSYEKLNDKFRACPKVLPSVDNIRVSETKIHEEQRRIGNGKTSIKIQNFR